MNKNLLIIVVVVVLAIVVGLLFFVMSPAPSPAPAPAKEAGGPVVPIIEESDSTSAISQDLEGFDLGNIDQDFESINADLNSL